jgi:hypothetical protein
LLGDRDFVSAILEGKGSPLTEKDRLLFDFLGRVNADSRRITREDVVGLKRAGWSEEAIFDAMTVCALFNFYNRWVDAAGVEDMPAETYQARGRWMAAHGYLPPEEEEA